MGELEKLKDTYKIPGEAGFSYSPTEKKTASTVESAALATLTPTHAIAIAVNNAWVKLNKYYELTDRALAYIAAVVINPQYK